MGFPFEVSEEDKRLVRWMRHVNVLESLDDEKFPEEVRRGAQFCCCADCDQFHDLYGHYTETCDHRRHGPISLYGGPLLIPFESRVNKTQVGETILEHLYIGWSLNKGRAIFLPWHFPCGMAYKHGIGLLEGLELVSKAKDTVTQSFRKRGADPEVMIHLHVDYDLLGEMKKRTYFFNRRTLHNELMKEHGLRRAVNA